MALNILIVDDSRITRTSIQHIISMVDLEIGQILEAENGQEALKVLTEADVDLVLADLNMPKMGGAEMIRHMKSSEATKSIPVVVVSTESRTTRIKNLLAEGVKEYLHKPFTPEEFRQIIQTLWSKQTPELGDLLTKAMAEALETMAFLTVMPMEDDLPVPEKTIVAEIGFSGAKSGKIQIIAGLDFCKILAENIGALEKADKQAACDALKEFSNVTCGLFLPMVVSSTADMFDITVPKIKSCSNSSQWEEFVADCSSDTLNIEGHAIATRLISKD